MAHPGIVSVKSFPYRGVAEEWSNIYHFVGPAPTTPATWKTMVDALTTAEAAAFQSVCKVVRVYGYSDTDQDAVYSFDYLTQMGGVIGTMPNASAQLAPGDAAAWIRWKTAKINSKGKAVYLRKYWHCVAIQSTSLPDTLFSSQKTALTALAGQLTNGTTIPGFVLCGPDGTAAGVAAVSSYITTRTLKRRGKRPPS